MQMFHTHTPCQSRVLFVRKTCEARITTALYDFDTALKADSVNSIGLGSRLARLISLTDGAKSVNEVHIV